jgi:hypothetical protein
MSDERELSVVEERPRTLQEMKAQKFLIQEFLSGVMKENVHYGTIPGTPKPTLYKAGAEVILSGLNLAVEPVETNLSTPDEAHYIVHVRIVTMKTRQFIGEGIGEASSNEVKYKWRAAVCDEEFEETPIDRRREVWKKGSPPFKIKQVRTEPADIANTVLKMAKKRAQIDATLTCTAASDIFAQDMEDLRDNGINPADVEGDGNEEAPAPVKQPQAKGAPAKTAPAAKAPAGANATDFTGEVKFVGQRTFPKKDGTDGSVHVVTASNGIKYETFSDTFADTARTALANGTAVHITAEKNQYGYKMKSIDPVLEG